MSARVVTVGQRVGGPVDELPAGVVQVLDLEAVGGVDARALAGRAARHGRRRRRHRHADVRLATCHQPTPDITIIHLKCSPSTSVSSTGY